MQQANHAPRAAVSIQEGEGEVVKLTLAGFKDVVLYLSVQQARAFASDLILHTHRIEVKNSLKKAKIKATQSAGERSGTPLVLLVPHQA